MHAAAVVVVVDGWTDVLVVVVVGPGVDDVVNTIPVCGGSVACCTTLPSRSV